MNHETDLLQRALKEIVYPPQMEFADRGILGDGFYPGARGTLGMALPKGKVMLLGRDFGTKDYYQRLCGLPSRSETAFTWTATKAIYLDVFNPSDVWCTNYLMGVRRSGSAVGDVARQIEPRDWVAYESSCWSFLLKQIELQKPQLIVVLGKDNLRDLTKTTRINTNLQPCSYAEGEGALCEHTFVLESGLHKARIYFATHPNYAKGFAKADFVRRQAVFALSQFLALRQ